MRETCEVRNDDGKKGEKLEEEEGKMYKTTYRIGNGWVLKSLFRCYYCCHCFEFVFCSTGCWGTRYSW